jgi:Bacterial Ig-like domain
MSTRRSRPLHQRLFAAGSLALAVLALSACGGDDAEAPPRAPQGNSDTSAPVITITDNVPATTATADVTFTFAFNKDVGTSFTVDDITVTGGTKGTFTRGSGTAATLVVVPTPNSSGTIVVTVPANAATDAVGNGNALTTSQQAYETVVRTQMSLPVSFDTAGVGYGLAGFAGAENSTIVADPTDAANQVAKVVRAAGAEAYAGTTITDTRNNVQLGFAPKIPFSTGNTSMTVRVWSPDANIPVRLKVEDSTDPNKSVETEATVTTAGAWQTLTFNFANQVSGTAALNLATNYNKATIFFDFGRPKANAVEKTYYFDDVAFASGSSGGACGSTAPTCAPTTSIPAGSITIYSDASSVAGLNMAPDWGQNNVTRTEVTIASNKSQRYVFGGAPFLYQGIDWTGPAGTSTIDVSGKTNLHLDIWSADVASVKISLIGGGSENAITRSLTAGAWNSIDIDLALYTSPDKTRVIQLKLEPVSAGTLYVDNIYFDGTASTSGGGGGTFTGGIFSSDYSGNLGAGTAKSDKGGNVGFFLDPRLFADKVFEDGSVCGSACNPGGVFNFYYGIGKPATSNYADAYFGAFVNAPGNTTADASAYSKVRLKFWGDAESWEKPNFTAQVDVILQGPTNGACSNPSGRPELTRTVAAQKIGAGSDYVINKADFTLTASCGGAYTRDSVWAAVGAVVVRLTGAANLNFVNTTPSTPPSFPTFINVGPISFIN